MGLFNIGGSAHLHPDWKVLEDEAQWEELKAASNEYPVAIFKHSTRCAISATVKRQVENEWPFAPEQLTLWYLDLLRHRTISDRIAQELGVWHESPQLIVLHKEDVIYQASHGSIDLGDVGTAIAA